MTTTTSSFRISDLTGKRPHVPDGLYTVRTVDSRRVHPVACTPGYRVEFEVTQGEAARGRFAHIVWLGEITPEQSLEWLAPFDVGRPQGLRDNELDGFELIVAFERVYQRRRYLERVRVLEVLSRPRRSAEQDARLGHTEIHWQQNPPPGEYDLLVIDQAVARGKRRKRVGWHLTLEVRSGHYKGYTISYFLPTDPIFEFCGRDVLAAPAPENAGMPAKKKPTPRDQPDAVMPHRTIAQLIAESRALREESTRLRALSKDLADRIKRLEVRSGP